MSWQINTEYEILSIEGATAITERLSELGFLIGEKIKILYKTPFGEPIVVQVGDTSVALRKKELLCLQLK